MVKQSALDSIFHALADPTRRGILAEVSAGDPTVAELGAPYAMSAPAISKHLKVLEMAGLLTRIKEGKVNRFRLNAEVLREAMDWLRDFDGVLATRADGAEDESSSVVEELEDYLL